MGSLQTVVVYGIFILLYRKVPARRKRRAEEDPHPWGLPLEPSPPSLI
jgi:hypothetical protein